MEFKKFSSIEQFRNTIKSVSDYCKHKNKPLSKLSFRGTVKLHGTNAGIGYNIQSDTFLYQSRERLLSLQSDNAGFALWSSSKQSIFSSLFREIAENRDAKNTIRVFGEWCGENIQKNVALNQLPKMFVIFSIEVDDVEIDIKNFQTSIVENHNGIYSIYDFPNWEIEVDFANPQAVQNQLVDITIGVENECPVGKQLGVIGIGEGVVYHNFETGLKFKVKGEKHSVSKVKTLRELAPLEVQKIESTHEFIDNVVTENRLNQGLDKLRELGHDSTDFKNIGSFIKWVANDVFKEEFDTIVENQFDSKAIGGAIAQKARTFYMNQGV